ncbi:MAG: tetratricopeptide repeat protein [Planctomycetota bacterium]|jgi:tetratricopeptide (TPR) repeat protein
MAVDITKFITKAHNAIERRNYDLAIFNYKQALMFQPENIDAREKLRAAQNRKFSESGVNPAVAILKGIVPIVKSVAFSVLGKHEETIMACEDSLTAYPNFKFIMSTLAKSAAELEFYSVAIWQTEEVLNKFDPDNVDVMYDLVDWLAESGREREAIEYCEQIKEIDPDSDIDITMRELSAQRTTVIFQKGATEGARSIVKSSEEARELEIESQIARTDEMRKEKITALEKKLEDRPDDYKTMMRIGDTWYDYEAFDEGYTKAKESYLKAKEIMPSDHNIDVKLGDLEIKKLTRLARGLKSALDKSGGKDEDARKKYMASYKQLKSFQIGEFERRVKDQPLISLYHFELGKLYYETKQNDKAVAEFQHSCKDPKIAIKSYTFMGRAFSAMGQDDLAIDMYNKAIDGQEVFDKIRDTIYYLGTALEKNGNLKEALEHYTRIFEDDITYKDIKDKVTNIREKLKK